MGFMHTVCFKQGQERDSSCPCLKPFPRMCEKNFNFSAHSISIFRSNAMEENGITFADYIVNRVCPDNRFLEEMNRVIP